MINQQKIWQAALKKIQIKPLSQKEMELFLIAKFTGEEDGINEVIRELKRLNFLNDEKLLEQLLDHLTEKPIGRFKIKNEVKKRFLNIDQIEESLNRKDWSEKESAQKAIEIKNRILTEKDPQKRKQKIMMFLKSRGFSNEIIYRVIR